MVMFKKSPVLGMRPDVCGARAAQLVFAGFSLMLAGIGLAHASTSVNGPITANTTWTAAQSPVIVQGAVTVDQDATLTIEPGVQVRMGPGASMTLRAGAIQAVGTANLPIVVTSANVSPAPGDWGQWKFQQGTRGADTRLAYVRIEYGSGIVVEQSSPQFSDLSVLHHNAAAIQIDLESSPTGQRVTAQGNSVDAIVVTPGVIRGQVQWSLQGLPYLVRQGLVEVGGAAMSLEPAQLQVGAGASASMRLVLGVPAPANGRSVNLRTSDAQVAAVAASITVPAGASSISFDVSGVAVGQSQLTADTGDGLFAQAQINVIQLPSIYLDTSFSRIGQGLPYDIPIRLSTPAPAGGLLLTLASQPANSLELPGNVTIPAGTAQATVTIRGRVQGRNQLLVQAPGYQGNGRWFDINKTGLRLDLQDTQAGIVAGMDYGAIVSIDHQAPTGGMAVSLAASDPAVLAFVPSTVTVPAGESSARPSTLLRALSKGQSSVTLSASGAQDVTWGPLDVLAPRELLWKTNGVQPTKAWVGKSMRMTQGLTLTRQREGVDLREAVALQVQLRCVNSALCNVPSTITIPAWSESVDVPVTGLATGVTQIEAQAAGTSVISVPVEVVEPVVDWSMNSKHYLSERSFFDVCLSIPQTGMYGSHAVLEDWPLQLSVQDQSPAGTISGIYDSPDNGAISGSATILSGALCAEGRYLAAAQRGQYRVRASSAGRLDALSPLRKVYADQGLAFKNTMTEGTTLSVAQGFKGDITLVPDLRGASMSIPAALTVRLRCLDASVCAAPVELTVPVGEDGIVVPVEGLAVGVTELEATVVGEPVNYPDAYTTRVEVTAKQLRVPYPFNSPQVGERQQGNVCIGVDSPNSYSEANFPLAVASTATGIVAPVATVIEWPARTNCVLVEYQGISAGSASLTFSASGLPNLTEAVEVRP